MVTHTMATDTLVFVSCADSGELHVLRLASDSGRSCPESDARRSTCNSPLSAQETNTRVSVAIVCVTISVHHGAAHYPRPMERAGTGPEAPSKGRPAVRASSPLRGKAPKATQGVLHFFT